MEVPGGVGFKNSRIVDSASLSVFGGYLFRIFSPSTVFGDPQICDLE